MAGMTAKPKLTLDIGPMLDDQWTGIPVFTRRLAQCLLRHGGIDVEFSVQLTRIPQSHVLSAIDAGTGTLLDRTWSALTAKATESSIHTRRCCFRQPRMPARSIGKKQAQYTT